MEDSIGSGELLVLVGNDCFNHENSGDDDEALGDDEEDDEDDGLTVAVAVEMGRGCSDARVCDGGFDCDCGG